MGIRSCGEGSPWTGEVYCRRSGEKKQEEPQVLSEPGVRDTVGH